jgi:VWFA-related protein
MSIWKLSAGVAVVLALASATQPAAQEPQSAGATFRSRVDVITVDVAAVDKQGRAVEDLRPGDFSVKVDGRSRPVVSAQLVKVDRSRPAASPTAAETFVSTNVGPQSGRRVIVAVDQTLIVPGSIAPLMRSASQFVDALAPADYAALLAFPEPGPRVDFTTDKAQVRQAMQGIVGQPAKTRTTTFNLSLQEAQAIDRSEKTFVNIQGRRLTSSGTAWARRCSG